MDDVRAILTSGADPNQKLDQLGALCFAPEPEKPAPKAKPAKVEQPGE